MIKEEKLFEMFGYSLGCVKINNLVVTENRLHIYRTIQDFLMTLLAFIKLEKYKMALRYAHQAFNLSINHEYVHGMLLSCRRFITIYNLKGERNLEYFYIEVRRKITAGLK